MPNNSEGWIWWGFSVLIVGVLINVLSAYLIPFIDKWLEKLSDYRRITNEQERMKIDKEAIKLINHPEDLAGFFAYRITIAIFQSAFLLLGGISTISFEVNKLMTPNSSPTLDTKLVPSGVAAYLLKSLSVDYLIILHFSLLLIVFLMIAYLLTGAARSNQIIRRYRNLRSEQEMKRSDLEHRSEK